MIGLQLRDKNGIEIHQGDKAKVVFWDKHRGDYVGAVNYDKANACWNIGPVPIHSIGRDRGTTIEILEHLEGEGAKPLKSRKKGKPS